MTGFQIELHVISNEGASEGRDNEDRIAERYSGLLDVLQTLRLTSQALWLAARPSGWPLRTAGWPPDPQADCPETLVCFHTFRLASVACWLDTQLLRLASHTLWLASKTPT